MTAPLKNRVRGITFCVWQEHTIHAQPPAARPWGPSSAASVNFTIGDLWRAGHLTPQPRPRRVLPSKRLIAQLPPRRPSASNGRWRSWATGIRSLDIERSPVAVKVTVSSAYLPMASRPNWTCKPHTVAGTGAASTRVIFVGPLPRKMRQIATSIKLPFEASGRYGRGRQRRRQGRLSQCLAPGRQPDKSLPLSAQASVRCRKSPADTRGSGYRASLPFWVQKP